MGNVGTKRDAQVVFKEQNFITVMGLLCSAYTNTIILRTQTWRIGRMVMRPVANRYTGNGAEVRVLHSPS